MDERTREVRRLLDRYLIEIVEGYDLCPWARGSRVAGEVGIDILWGTPTVEMWVAAALPLLATSRVVMVVAPELAIGRIALHRVREEVSSRIGTAGVAEFHPDAEADTATPARLVPYLRRSPDPMLQLVPLALLESVRSPPPAASLARQAELLGGNLTESPRDDIADRIAADNHARVMRDRAEIAARFIEIEADRARSYARVGISTSR